MVEWEGAWVGGYGWVMGGVSAHGYICCVDG